MNILLGIILILFLVSLVIGLGLFARRRPWPREQHPSYFQQGRSYTLD